MRRLRLRRPSPALVISLIALFVALGGTSYAAIKIGARNLKTGSVGTRAVKNATLSGRDMRRAGLSGREINEGRLGAVPTAGGTTHWSVVTAAGLQARGRGVTSVTRTNTGRYQVIFDRDVRNCAYSASIGDVGAVNPPRGEIAVSALATNVNGVFIQARNGGDNAPLANRPFHLIVSC